MSSSPAKGAQEMLDSGFLRRDLVRLMLQSIQGLGYHNTAATLEAESQIKLVTAEAQRFRQAVLDGDWDVAVSLIPALQLESQNQATEFRLRMLEQKYLELVDEGQYAPALDCLRREIAGICPEPQRLCSLTTFLLCSRDGELRARCGWSSADDAVASRGAARRALLSSLQAMVPPSVMLPEQRLEHLLQVAISRARPGAASSGAADPVRVGLFQDETTEPEAPPTCPGPVLQVHRDQVWLVAFSNTGAYLASSSRDAIVVVWSMASQREGEPTAPPSAEEVRYEPSLLHFLSGHTKPVLCAAWSPNDRLFLTGAEDSRLKLWSTETGRAVHSLDWHTADVTACVWLADGRHFLSGGLDRLLILWNTEGRPLRSWQGMRVMDLALARDNIALLSGDRNLRYGSCATCLRGACAAELRRDHRLLQMPLDDSVAPGSLPECGVLEDSDTLTALSASRDGRYLLVSTVASEIHAWDLVERAIVHKYRGHKAHVCVLRPSFGGHDDSLVLSGCGGQLLCADHTQGPESANAMRARAGAKTRSFTSGPLRTRPFSPC